MTKTVFIIGANSAVAKETIRLLRVSNTVITGGRAHCDVYCDITQPLVIPDGVDVVVNFAAAFDESSDAAIMNIVQTNSVGMLHICMASKKAKVAHVINISSLSAVHSKESPYYSFYALSKRNGDDLAELYCKRNELPLTILRPSQVYGSDVAFAAHQPFLYHIIGRAEKGEDITVYGNNDALRNYLYVTDLGETVNRVITQSFEGTYPCLYPTNVRFTEIAQVAQETFKKGGRTVFLDGKPDIPDNVFDLDVSIYEKIGYYPQVTLEQGIQKIKAYKGDSQT